MNIGYTLGILFKNIYLGMILIVVYTFVIPSSYTVLDIKNSLHYIGVRLFDFHGVLAIDYPKDGTTLITSILVLLRSEEHTSELQSRGHLVCRLLLEKKKTQN